MKSTLQGGFLHFLFALHSYLFSSHYNSPVFLIFIKRKAVFYLKKLIFVLCIVLVFQLPAKAESLSLSAASAILIDARTGDVIYEKNADKKMPMASTTKIMTAICTLDNINSNVPITVNSDAEGIEGSSVYLKAGERITIKELLCAMLLNSGNDAATALALEVAGSIEGFAKIMNKTARKIGALSSNFTNPSGLYEQNHYTTARDLAKIAACAMENPLIRWMVSTKEMKISNGQKNGGRFLKNHNKLLWQYEGCTGIKTGYTKKCGRCLVSSAKRDGKELIAVSLNAPDDWRDHKILFDYGFNKK